MRAVHRITESVRITTPGVFFGGSWWTYACWIDRDDIDWATLRAKFVELGGDGYYGAYQPVHREPVFAHLYDQVQAHPKRFPHWAGVLPNYREVACPMWDSLQPRIIMFKTNYFDLDQATLQAEALGAARRQLTTPAGGEIPGCLEGLCEPLA